MQRFDRYMLSQLLTLFGFFALILVLIFWINKAVRLFDTLVSSGHATRIFLEFSTLILPATIALVLPIAAFAAATYVTNRLMADSELTVLLASGRAPLRLMRPVLVFGLLVALMMSLLTHVLVPGSQARLHQRQAEVARNIATQLLSEGEFLHPRTGITVYIRRIAPDGRLEDVFLSDLRDPGNSYVYTSENAYLVTTGTTTKLVMVTGLAQAVHRQDQRMSVTSFADFSFDISSLLTRATTARHRIGDVPTRRLIDAGPGQAGLPKTSPGQLALELHSRFAGAAFALVAALVGFATLIGSRFDRLGAWPQVVRGFLLLVLLKLLESLVTPLVLEQAALWPLLYLPGGLGAVAVAVLLQRTSRGRDHGLLLARRRRSLPA